MGHPGVAAKRKSAALKRRPASRGRRPAKRDTGGLRHRVWRWLRGVAVRLVVLAVVLGGAWTAWLDISVRAQFEGKRWQVPARIYARALELYAGQSLTAEGFVDELRAAGYRPVTRTDRPGTFVRRGNTFRVVTREFAFWDGAEPAHDLTLRFDAGRLSSLRERGAPLAIARLDPPVIGRIYPAHREDRILVRLDEVPEQLVAGLIAVEDRNFYHHFGLSPRAIARAAWANLRAGGTVQGGSTLTQQLAKNFFLSAERSLWRKANEALIALILEARYGKREILEAYLNEIYLGQAGSRSVNGFGLASEFYFGRPLQELRLHEMALLIGLARGASVYNPRRNPQRARARRNLVLDLMAERGVVSAAEARAAQRAPLGVLDDQPRSASAYPAFIDLVRRQLRRDYREEDLRSEGLRIFTTLSPRVQAAAERALDARLGTLARAASRYRGLEGAVIATDPRSGEVLALVGGRDTRRNGFNRVIDAVRPIGSLAKPAVYLTALEERARYNLLTPIDDAPVSVTGPKGRVWSPENYDRTSHGTVPLVSALAHSYNQATVRLGLDVGVARVARTMARLGIERDIPAYPSLLLGAVALSPLEVAQMYQTIAADGFVTPLRAIRDVTDADGKPLARYGLSVRKAFDSGPVFVLRRALIEVMREGTGRGAYRQLPAGLTVAGKTGTTDELRDSWFAGFAGDLLAVVWIGRDDNQPAGLTGASGALRVWSALMAAARPQPLAEQAPAGVEWAWADAGSGRLVDAGCPGARSWPFVSGSQPPVVGTDSASCKVTGSPSTVATVSGRAKMTVVVRVRASTSGRTVNSRAGMVLSRRRRL